MQKIMMFDLTYEKQMENAKQEWFNDGVEEGRAEGYSSGIAEGRAEGYRRLVNSIIKNFRRISRLNRLQMSLKNLLKLSSRSMIL